MEIVKLLLAASGGQERKLIVYSALSGLTTVLTLAVLNLATAAAAAGLPQAPLALVWVLCISISVLTQKFVWNTASKAAENLVHAIRTRIIDKVAGCDLERMEGINRVELYTAVSQHTYTVSITAPPIIISMQSLIVIGFTMFYLAYLSLTAFVLAAITAGAAISFSVARSHRANALIDGSIASEHRVYFALNELLDGFKEVKLNARRRAELTETAAALSLDARRNRVATNALVAAGFIGTQALLYFVLAALVFVLPVLSTTAYPETVVKLTTAALFLIGPVTSIVSIMPMFTHAEASINAIRRTETLLDENQEKMPGDAQVSPRFERLRLDGVTYDYRDADGRGFRVGPLSFEIREKDVIFITGGNGSGKTTLLRLVLSLYTPKAGHVEVNGSPVLRHHVAAHRALFATVLADYHLFSQNYGLGDIDQVLADRLLQRMGLGGKVTFREGRFDTLKLSTGQRKRLALVVAILEDRPVLVFDEWASDQDPEFRRIFYREIIPELRNSGKTVLAVTHDERYFDCCDRHLHMIEGELHEVDREQGKMAGVGA